MLLRLFFFIFLLVGGAMQVYAQLTPTFNFTVNDTVSYASLSCRPIEVDDQYYVASYGNGMDGYRGYFMITKLNETGELKYRELSSNRFYRISLGSLILVGNKFISAYTKTNTSSFLGGEYGVIEVVGLTLDLDTIWKHTCPKFRGSEGVGGLMWNPIDSTITITGTRIYRDSSSFNCYDGLFLKLTGEGDSLDFKVYENGSNLIFYSSIILGNFSYAVGREYTNGNIGYNGIVYKLDFNGNVISSKLYPNNFGLRISKYSESSYLLTGKPSNTSDNVARLICVDTSGAEISNKLHTFDYVVDQYISRRIENGNIISIGLADNGASPLNNGGFISCSDSLGNLIWYRKYQYNQNTDFFIDFL